MGEPKDTVRAQLVIESNVTCPKCQNYFDLFECSHGLND